MDKYRFPSPAEAEELHQLRDELVALFVRKGAPVKTFHIKKSLPEKGVDALIAELETAGWSIELDLDYEHDELEQYTAAPKTPAPKRRKRKSAGPANPATE